MLALSASFVGTAAADDQDDEVRALNIQALDNARNGDTDFDTTAPAPSIQPDGVGGPEFAAPPGADEGMTDDQDDGDEAAPPPDSDAPSADEPEDEAEPN